jgi:hypothetical protein
MANNEEHDIEEVAALESAVTEAEKCEDDYDDKDEKKSKKSKKKDHDDKDDMKEETLAASSLHPKAKASEPMSKVGMISHVTNQLASMGKSDLVDFFNKVQGQFGPNKMPGAVDNSSKNTSTLDMKGSDAVATTGPKTKDGMPKLDSKNHWAEDVEEMFGGSDLSEEFKEKTTTLFEAAVSIRVNTEIARLEEEYETKLNEEVANFNEELTSKLDTYLDYVVEQFMKENEVAIESTLRNELSAEFIDGLKNLFAEHYINVPEDKVDVVEAMAEKVAALETKLDEAITTIAEQSSVIVESAKNDIFEELSSDLALTQQEKFSALAEGIEFDGDLDVYARKLKIVKENYFKNDATTSTSNIEEETFEGETDVTKNIDPIVGRYVQAISRSVKK